MGKHKGLTLVLDAHQDLLSASSVSEDFQVKVDSLPQIIICCNIYFLTQGFSAIIDTKHDYAQTSREEIHIRPGHTVRIQRLNVLVL